MGEPLKNMYNKDSITNFANQIKAVDANFDIQKFISFTMDTTWNDLELKDRMHKIALGLGKFLPSDYVEATTILSKVISNYNGFFAMVCSDFIEMYGLDETYYDLSVSLLGEFTEYASSEFAVRPFILKYPQQMMKQMLDWSISDNEHIRRLASEGCRPQLPWAIALPLFKEDPTPILAILENLKNDPSEYVRRSVANNLNDISKTRPDITIKIAKEWYGNNSNLDKLVKHACRTLLKKGHSEVLSIFGYSKIDDIEVLDEKVLTPSIHLGEEMSFTFRLLAHKNAVVRIEYAIDFVKANGKRARKVFKISEIPMLEGESKTYLKKHSFKYITTRKYYPGIHGVTVIINGVDFQTLDFEVLS